MADSQKFTDRAADLANQAASAAAPIAAQAKDRATALAGQAAAAAGPIADQARSVASQGVDVLAGNLDKLTGGKFHDKIHSVASKVEGALDTKPKPPGAEAPEIVASETDPALRGETAPLKQQTAPLRSDAD